MRHQDLTINHILESWVYPDATSRNGATGLKASDVGRIAYQTNTGQYWRLTAPTPTWAALETPSVYASGTVGNPTGTTNTTGVMMGLAGSITPLETGRVLVMISGTISNTAASGGGKPQIRFGTGTAPVNAAALTGTALGNQPQLLNNASMAGAKVPFALMAVFGGVIGTTFWLDIGLAAIGSGTVTISDLNIAAVEI